MNSVLVLLFYIFTIKLHEDSEYIDVKNQKLMKKQTHPVVKSEFCLLKFKSCIPTHIKTNIVVKMLGKF